MKNIMRVRKEEQSNYYAIYCNGKTLRFQIEDDKPISELIHPEFYDVKLTSFCEGNCSWCYMNSTSHSAHVMDAVDKINQFFGPMTLNERPFQVALGGGNPNQHPDFVNILKAFDALKITPNYTTNGMGLTDEVLEATAEFCGGVALSCHPHLIEHWVSGVKKLSAVEGIKLSYHHVVADMNSVHRFIGIFTNPSLDDLVHYHVMLPQIAQGRAKTACAEEASKFLFDYLEGLPSERQCKVAFGARFYDDLLENKDKLPGVSLYEPEAFSKFLDLKNMKIYGSSFEASVIEEE